MLLAGILMGLAGVGVMVGGTALEAGKGTMLACIAILVGAFSWSVGIIYSRRSHLSGSPLLLSALSLLSGSAMLLVTGLLAGEAKGFTFAQVRPKSWVAMVYLSLFGSVAGFTAYNLLPQQFWPTLRA